MKLVRGKDESRRASRLHRLSRLRRLWSARLRPSAPSAMTVGLRSTLMQGTAVGWLLDRGNRHSPGPPCSLSGPCSDRDRDRDREIGAWQARLGLDPCARKPEKARRVLALWPGFPARPTAIMTATASDSTALLEAHTALLSRIGRNRTLRSDVLKPTAHSLPAWGEAARRPPPSPPAPTARLDISHIPEAKRRKYEAYYPNYGAREQVCALSLGDHADLEFFPHKRVCPSASLGRGDDTE